MASTRAGQFKGKLSYMAPEQASSSETDQRSDLFSVGIILWESLTGRRLFKGETNAATLNKLLNDTIVKPSELWPDLERFDRVVMKALDRNPERRFQTADELGEALDAAAGRAGVAKTRDVAEVVRSLDADKLQDERQRVRDSIQMLGHAEIAALEIPMPREGEPSPSRTYHRDGSTGSYVHGTLTGVLDDGTPVVVRSAPGSNALKWFVMALAVVVFLYAGFLVWQLLQTPGTREPAKRSPVMDLEPAPPITPDKPVAVDPAGTQTKTKTETEDSGSATPAPERKSSTTSPRPRRRRDIPKRRPRTTRTSEAEKPADKAASPSPAPPPDLDPVDIDIQNPYRN